MTILPLDPAADPSPAALRRFLEECRTVAAKRGRPQLVSISLQVEALDPLAVLESIFEAGERHFYVERPSENWALAGAEAVATFAASGADRFARCQAFIAELLENCIAVGPLAEPLAGPHFFCAFGFSPEAAEGAPFGAAGVFVPRWQVARRGGGSVAVANLMVGADAPLDLLTEKIWRAHGKFRAFEYRGRISDESLAGSATSEIRRVSEAGPPGGYDRAVAEALGLIKSGVLQKIVLARAKDLEANEPFHPLRVLNGLRQRFADCYSFSVANGRGQSFIGASPERLIRVENGRLLTEALAGTTRRGGSASEDGAIASALLHGEKELREHQVVLETVAERLTGLGLKPEYPARPDVRRYANVQHLHTPVRADVPSSLHLLEIAARLHPTPSVGGAPQEAALAHIGRLEGFSRGLYAGSLGWVDFRGGGELLVGLRAGLIDGRRARLYAGAGIVAGSSPENELAETELKFRAMQEAMLS